MEHLSCGATTLGSTLGKVVRTEYELVCIWDEVFMVFLKKKKKKKKIKINNTNSYNYIQHLNTYD